MNRCFTSRVKANFATNHFRLQHGARHRYSYLQLRNELDEYESQRNGWLRVCEGEKFSKPSRSSVSIISSRQQHDGSTHTLLDHTYDGMLYLSLKRYAILPLSNQSPPARFFRLPTPADFLRTRFLSHLAWKPHSNSLCGKRVQLVVSICAFESSGWIQLGQNYSNIPQRATIVLTAAIVSKEFHYVFSVYGGVSSNEIPTSLHGRLAQ